LPSAISVEVMSVTWIGSFMSSYKPSFIMNHYSSESELLNYF